MKYIRLKIAVLAITSLTVCSATGHAESRAVRNCTWCHGGAAQGYTPAPRLAGQRPGYIEKQLINFREHTRDNPFSKLYMWGAAANSQSAHCTKSCHLFFDDTPKCRQRRRQRAGRRRKSYLSGGSSRFQYSGLRSLPRPECSGRCGNSPFGRVSVHLLAEEARAVG